MPCKPNDTISEGEISDGVPVCLKPENPTIQPGTTGLGEPQFTQDAFVKIRIQRPLLADELQHKTSGAQVTPRDFSFCSTPGVGIHCARHATGLIPKDLKGILLLLNPTSQARPLPHTQFSFKLPPLGGRRGSPPRTAPLSVVWTGFLTPYVELMRSHSQEEPSIFLVLCPPP